MITAFILLAQLHTLLPAPAELSFSPGRLPVDSSFRIRFEGLLDERLRRAADRFTVRLLRVAGLEAVGAPGPDSTSGGLVIAATADDPAPLDLGADESYRLEVTGAGARLTSPRPLATWPLW